ncbi:MAG: hypothetical protein U5L98_17315 [Halomonas sp.]|nr:hypothetical protein [Halomonas sp.]
MAIARDAAAVALLASLLVLHGLLETALLGLLEDLGTAPLAVGAHDVHLGFLAAHQLALDRVDQAVVDQRL